MQDYIETVLLRLQVACERALLCTAALGVLLTTAVNVTGSFDLGKVLGTPMGWAPYLGTAAAHMMFLTSKRVARALAGGLALYLPLDLYVRYWVTQHTQSSTNAVVVVVIMFLSPLIVGGGAVVCYPLV